MMNRLALQMQAKIQQSENLQSLNVVMIKATIAEAMLAAGLDVPIGLSILKGMVKLEDETMVSAKEFFQKQGNPEAIANQSRVEINGISEAKIRERIEIALNKLDNAGVDTVELRTRLENAGANQLNQIQSEVRIKANAPVDSNKPDDAGNDQDQGSDNSNKPDNPGNSGNSNKGNP